MPLVQHVSTGVANTALVSNTIPILSGVKANNTLILLLQWQLNNHDLSMNVSSISDTGGGNWQTAYVTPQVYQQLLPGTSCGMAFFYQTNPSPTHQVTITLPGGATSFDAITMMLGEFSGGYSQVDQIAVANANTTLANIGNTIPTTQYSELLLVTDFISGSYVPNGTAHGPVGTTWHSINNNANNFTGYYWTEVTTPGTYFINQLYNGSEPILIAMVTMYPGGTGDFFQLFD